MARSNSERIAREKPAPIVPAATVSAGTKQPVPSGLKAALLSDPPLRQPRYEGTEFIFIEVRDIRPAISSLLVLLLHYSTVA